MPILGFDNDINGIELIGLITDTEAKEENACLILLIFSRCSF
jgi:hypothetical protein